MTFDSLTFAAFLALVFPVYALTRAWNARKNILLIASCVFYGAWNPFFLILLAFTTVFDWWAGKRIDSTSNARQRQLWMFASVTASLSLLGYFKYAQFFANSAAAFLAHFGVAFTPFDLGIVLPLGISFYTFESISYIVDVYKKRIKPTKSLRDYGLFMTFFPHLVAGPIMRFSDFNAQVTAPRMVSGESTAAGFYLLIAGLFLKIVAADQIFSPLAEVVFNPSFIPEFSSAWFGAFSFSMQVYCDFAGYSLAAIGIAKIFGFHLPANFEAPFASVGIAELWTRWHISLSNWLRDYVFNPLGHYRKGRARGYLNVLITFTACGFWHGAAWHFVAWGALHGLFLVFERILKDAIGAWRVWDTRVMRIALALFTFSLFTFAVVFFRASSLPLAWQQIKAMLGLASANALSLPWNADAKVCAAAIIAALLIQAWLKNKKGWDWLVNIPWPIRIALLSLMSIAIILSPGKSNAFIYFQF